MDSAVPVPGSWEDRDITRFVDPPHPSFEEAIKAVLAEYDGPRENVTRIQIGVQSNRECAYKVWVKESEEAMGGVLTL